MCQNKNRGTVVLGEVCKLRLPSHCQGFIWSEVYLHCLLCNTATSIKLLNVALLRVTDLGAEKVEGKVQITSALGS